MPEFNIQACNLLRNSNKYDESEIIVKKDENGSIFGCEFKRYDKDFTPELFKCEQNGQKRIEIDKKIGDFRQGLGRGDCWFLSSLKALSNTPEGKKIIKESIKEDDCGNVTVTFKGGEEDINKIFLAREELNIPMGYATGDGDVEVLERAMMKYRRNLLEKQLSTADAKLYDNLVVQYSSAVNPDAGNPLDAFDLLVSPSGREAQIFTKNQDNPDDSPTVKSVKKYIGNPKKIPTVVSFYDTNVVGDRTTFKVGNSEIHNNHAYALLEIKNDILYLINPQRTKDPAVKVKIKDLIEHSKTHPESQIFVEAIDLKKTK